MDASIPTIRARFSSGIRFIMIIMLERTIGVNRKVDLRSNSLDKILHQLLRCGQPHLGDAGMGAECLSDRTWGTREELYGYMWALANRLRKVRVCCGDWSRVCGPSPTIKLGTTGVFLDPPYSDEAERNETLYSAEDLSVAHDVREWCLEWGDHPDMRIALCGYEGEHEMPDTWDCVAWKAKGGYGSQGNGSGRENAHRERIWFSPHCLGSRQGQLFSQE